MLERIFIIAGPNGAGKTTFAMELLPRELGVLDFIHGWLYDNAARPARLIESGSNR